MPDVFPPIFNGATLLAILAALAWLVWRAPARVYRCECGAPHATPVSLDVHRANCGGVS